ncbi:MAG TPA: hypothetical protein VGN88_06735, partial [Phycisphaerae bacterium]
MSEPSQRAPDAAIQIIQKFIDASLKHDMDTMRTCLSRNTLEAGGLGEGTDGVRYTLGESSMEGDIAIVPIHTFPADSPSDSPPAMVLPAMVIREDGTWKFDLASTMDRLMTGTMQAAISQVADTMGQAMEGIGQAMSQAFGESPSSPQNQWLESPAPDYTAEELLPLPEMAPFPNISSTLSLICGHTVSAGCAIKDLLHQLGSDDRDVLINWFDNELFKSTTTLFSSMAQRYPVVRRIRGFRVEAARHADQRMLILDGSDLVYRVWLNTTSGYYSDEYFYSLLPGILAALPENPDPKVEGHRLIHTDEEIADLELFKSHAVPRFMRRISELLGKNIALQAEWDDIFNKREDTRQLYRWTLNRIHGALALACLDPALREKLAAELTTIKLIWASSAEDREANLTAGILTIAICYFREEQGCFYERDLERVLAGEPIAKIIVPDPPEEASSDQETDQEEKEAAEDDTDDEDDQPQPSPEEAARQLNDTNFRTAAVSLKQNEPIWATQLELVFKHPTSLSLDFDSLNGTYDLVQPFIHQALTGSVEALTKIAFDPECEKLVQSIHAVIIRQGNLCQATLTAGTLTLHIPLKIGDFPPPTGRILYELQLLA